MNLSIAVLLIVAASIMALVLAIARMLKAPSVADRIIALDVLLSAAIALCIAAGLSSGRVLFMDAAVVLALVGFVATIVWARVVDRSGDAEDLA
ncbi:monovalent cation/H+ antiporter complex subunit F [Silanimonas sp.]|uniref:monovalent cation/H+ antiporter complex subunit F n=1 Tax=Silanimonas sp. TaxID=1929290 RepID=UPI001BC6ECC6|nr:monovalent cation/H+ antiporter complex subunit F [Silanimonas sp.]MBS3895694.1 K+/H+ antiporter subunit F [Silanimonas sp.]MBS3924387.1 K+/H+ antiporter subunit F [Xanthomonadaceae bacterium]